MFFQEPIGFLSLLDLETRCPLGSDASFCAKLALHSEAFSRSAETIMINKTTKGTGAIAEFRITHYAGEVCYVANGFLEKNLDNTVSDELVQVMISARQGNQF